MRILLCGLVAGAFVLTLAFYRWRGDPQRSAPAPAPRAMATRDAVTATPTDEVAAGAAAANPAAAVAPPEPAQAAPNPIPDVDNGQMDSAKMRDRRDPAAGHDSRSR
jgi:hypothetical protein